MGAYSRILLPWDSQPQEAVEIDWSHPLTRGLRLAVIGGQSRNLVDGVFASSVALISPGVGSEGRTWTADAPSAIANARGIVFPFDLSGALTVHLIVLRAASVNDADSSRVANAITNRNNSQANFWQLNLGSGFGASGDGNKPRFATAAVGVGTIYANGAALSGNNPTTVALANQTWYRITAAKASGATDNSGSNQLTLGAERAAPTDYYGLNGSIALALAWTRELSAAEVAQLAGREYELFQPRSIWVPVSAGAGGSATDLTIQEATHSHTADSLTITVASTLAIQEATHAHNADSLALTLDTTLAIADATHGHTADNLTLSVSGATDLTIQDATHGHSVDSLALTLGYADLVIADALHGHTADNVTLGGLYTDLELILKILSNRQELNAGTGTFTIYDDDSVSVLFTTSAWADAAGTVPYSGGTLGRIDALA